MCRRPTQTTVLPASSWSRRFARPNVLRRPPLTIHVAASHRGRFDGRVRIGFALNFTVSIGTPQQALSRSAHFNFQYPGRANDPTKINAAGRSFPNFHALAGVDPIRVSRRESLNNVVGTGGQPAKFHFDAKCMWSVQSGKFFE